MSIHGGKIKKNTNRYNETACPRLPTVLPDLTCRARGFTLWSSLLHLFCLWKFPSDLTQNKKQIFLTRKNNYWLTGCFLLAVASKARHDELNRLHVCTTVCRETTRWIVTSYSFKLVSITIATGHLLSNNWYKNKTNIENPEDNRPANGNN